MVTNNNNNKLDILPLENIISNELTSTERIFLHGSPLDLPMRLFSLPCGT